MKKTLFLLPALLVAGAIVCNDTSRAADEFSDYRSGMYDEAEANKGHFKKSTVKSKVKKDQKSMYGSKNQKNMFVKGSGKGDGSVNIASPTIEAGSKVKEVNIIVDSKNINVVK